MFCNSIIGKSEIFEKQDFYPYHEENFLAMAILLEIVAIHFDDSTSWISK